MSERRTRSQERGSQDPRVVDRSPLIVDIEPEGERRPSRESTRTVYSIRNPISGRPYGVVKETTKYKYRQSESDGEPSFIKSTTRHGRSTAPPKPPVIHQERPRSVSPTYRPSTMPGQEQKHVPLPDKIPTDEDNRQYPRHQQERERRQERRRESRQSFQPSPPAEPEARAEPERPRSRQRRPYSGQLSRDNPMTADQERVESNTPHYEYFTPNESVRSRNRVDNRSRTSAPDSTEVTRTKEYRELKEQGERYRVQAEQNYEAYSKATQIRTKIEDQLQLVTQELADVKLRESQEKKYADHLLKKIDEMKHALDDCKLELRTSKLEISRLERERDRNEEERREIRERNGKSKEKSRDDTDSAPSAPEGSSRNRQRRKVIIKQVAPEEEPRTSPTTSLPGYGPTTRQPVDDDMGDAAIRQARADLAKEQAREKARGKTYR